MKKLLLVLIGVCCFTLATALDPYFQELNSAPGQSASVLVSLLGDSRRLFANHFFAKADAYFHGGLYPGIFDQPMREGHSHMEGEHEHEEHEDHHSEEETFLGPPRDFLDKFGRNFYFTEHKHLEGGNEREMLPWIKLAAETDPQSPETYVTGAYWLTRMKRTREAEVFLREGLYANPNSFEILLELGRIYATVKNDPKTARNLFNLAAAKWRWHADHGQEPDPIVLGQIYGELVQLDKQENNRMQWLADLEELEKVSPDKEAVAKSIAELKARTAH